MRTLQGTLLPTAALAAVAAMAAVSAAPAQGQQPPWTQSAPPAWLGVAYDLRWIQSGPGCESRVVIASVVPGSPAERAGLRPGDAIVAVNGDAAAALRVQLLGARLAPGDSVRLVIERHGATRGITAVADRRPDRPPLMVPGDRGPIIHVQGDTVMASNVEAARFSPQPGGRGYWVAGSGGELSFRRLPARPRADLDRRVASLLLCADTAGRALSLPARADMERIQEQAESLRVVIARRAIGQQDLEGRTVRLREAAAARAAVAGLEGRDVLLFRTQDALATSVRGVSGAELVTLEPELAAYFQGARDGLLVVRVAPGTAAERSGLRPGDVITAAAGSSVSTPAALRAVVTGSDAPVELAVVRQGRRRTVSLPRP
jgi:membrane-associated protease RseP (regulator of RpoE activity)